MPNVVGMFKQYPGFARKYMTVLGGTVFWILFGLANIPWAFTRYAPFEKNAPLMAPFVFLFITITTYFYEARVRT
jgi:hypothetical protein